MDDNLALAKKAYSWFEVPSAERTREHLKPYFDLMADDVVFKGSWSADTPVYGGETHGKSAVMKLVWEDDQEAVDGNDLERPPRFFVMGDSVAIQNRQCWRVRSTGRWVRGLETCTILTFVEGRIQRILVIEDLSVWNAHSKEG